MKKISALILPVLLMISCNHHQPIPQKTGFKAMDDTFSQLDNANNKMYQQAKTIQEMDDIWNKKYEPLLKEHHEAKLAVEKADAQKITAEAWLKDVSDKLVTLDHQIHQRKLVETTR